MIITKKKYKKIYFDYYFCDELKIVSEELLSYLNNNGIDKTYYEKVVLNILDLNGKALTERNYLALRFTKDDKDYFNFNVETKTLAIDSVDSYFSFFDENYEGGEIQKEDDTGFYIYPDIELKKTDDGKNIYSLFEFYYRDSLIFNKTVKKYISENFIGTEIYKINDFQNIVNHYNFEELPKKNKYRIYK
jgi:hypothetical protein